MLAQSREHAERNLGALVIAIEFTLISVMVGVMLSPLMESATPILRQLKFEYTPYIVSGLILILYIWTEAISHSLSFIGWPIDIKHNLLYIVFALGLAIQMHFLQEPQAWFAMTCLAALIAAVISYYDLRLIRKRRQGSSGAAEQLFDAAYKRQQGLVHTAPITLGNAILQAALIFLFPTFFINDHWHLLLIAIQIAAFLYLLQRTLHHFKAQRELIVAKAVQELWAEEHDNSLEQS